MLLLIVFGARENDSVTYGHPQMCAESRQCQNRPFARESRKESAVCARRSRCANARDDDGVYIKAVRALCPALNIIIILSYISFNSAPINGLRH